MKTIALVLMSLTLSNIAAADGFKCEGVNTGVTLQVYNHTQPVEGTRTPAVMVVASSLVRSPNKTIAVFKHENDTLAYLGNGLFQGKIDLQNDESIHKGENIAGTKLGYLKAIQLQLFAFYGKKFSYKNADLFKNNEIMDARISYLKLTGEVLEEKAICSRYLKN